MNTGDLIGLTEAKADAKIRDSGYASYIYRRDKEIFGGPYYYRPRRVLLSIDNGKVTKATIEQGVPYRF